MFLQKRGSTRPLSRIEQKKANVSEATVYEYFLSKEDLLFSIPQEETLEHLKKNEELLQYIPGATNKLSMLIEDLLSLADGIIKNIFQGILIPSKKRELTVQVTLEQKKSGKLP